MRGAIMGNPNEFDWLAFAVEGARAHAKATLAAMPEDLTEVELKQCEQCGEWFDELADGEESGRFCSESCADLHAAEEDEDNTCCTCQGTGEGMYDGASCSSCRGSGVNRCKPEIDDFDPPSDFDF